LDFLPHDCCLDGIVVFFGDPSWLVLLLSCDCLGPFSLVILLVIDGLPFSSSPGRQGQPVLFLEVSFGALISRAQLKTSVCPFSWVCADCGVLKGLCRIWPGDDFGAFVLFFTRVGWSLLSTFPFLFGQFGPA